ncbi:MAG: ABC transporter substrate-binding protein, partial [Chloroflexota bacterium]
MQRPGRKWNLIIGALGVGLLLVSCAPAAPPAPTPKAPAASAPTKAPQVSPSATPAPKPSATPAAKPAASPAAKPAATPAAPTPSPKPAGEQPKYGGVLTKIVYDDPPSLDAHQETSAVTLWVVGAVYNGLLEYDPLENQKVISDLAEKWEVNPDGTSYTFYLRQGVKWHDGKPFTAEDARFSLERIVRPPKGTRGPRVGVFGSVDKIEAP